MAASDNTCPCPQGYTRDQSGLNCVKTTSVNATNNGTTYTAVAGAKSTFYGVNGAKFYEDVTLLPFPILFAPSGSGKLQDASGHYLLVNNSVGGPLWQCSGNTADGRLNNTGLWTNIFSGADLLPLDEWIGFSVCIDVPETATYCIGMAADNACRFSLDGQVIVEIRPAPAFASMTFPFSNWHILPITLSAGKHVIAVEGLNFQNIAAFGAEIYNATPAQLAAIVTPAALSAVTVFTTENRAGQGFQTGTQSGYSCPAGYSLDTCGPTLTCSIYESIPYNCCYLITNCTTGATHIVSTDLSTYVSSGQVITIAEFPGCWSVSTAQDCTTTITVSNITAYANCQSCAPCFRLTNCVTGAVIVTSTDLSSSLGLTVNLSGTYGGCWTVTSSPDCTGSVAVTYVSTSPSCISCLPCFLLRNCEDERQFVTTNTNLTLYVGQVVQIAGYPDICWTVSATSGCTQSTPIVIVKAFASCAACAKKCYLLTNCEDGSTILTDTDLSLEVGNVIQIKGCVGRCWTVSLADTCVGTEPVEQTASFATCELCDPPLVCPPPELLRQRRVKPGYDTPGCTPEYTEKVNCTFAEQVYNVMKKRRYGITTCCDEDLQKWTIKKALLDLRAIYDSEICRTCPPITCCTPCPAPTPPTPPTPSACPTPTDITAVITLVTPCEDVVSVEGAVITFNNPRSF